MRAPILMYHALGTHEGHPDGPDHDPRFTVSARDFGAQMSFLARAGRPVLSLDEFCREMPERDVQSAVVLTFDDGYVSDNSIALPVLREHCFRATFFIVTGSLGESGRQSPRGVRGLAAAGMEIGSHTVTHRFLSDLASGAVRRELGDSKCTLEDLTGTRVRFLSVPGGRFDHRTLEIARECGYDAVCTSVPGGNPVSAGAFLLRRLCIRRRTDLRDFARLVQLEPARIVRERLRYTIRRGAKRLVVLATGRRASRGVASG